MKAFRAVILLFLVLAGCTSRTIEPRLAHVCSLADVNETDSALALLDSIEKNELNEYNYYYYELMCIKVRDKAYLDVTQDSIIDEIIEYFEDNGRKSEKGEAYYYGGRVYREMGDFPQALDYFQKSLNLLDDKDIVLKGKVASQMGQLFKELCLYMQAKPCFREAIRCQNLCNDSAGLMFNYRNMGETHKWLNENDSVLDYYKKSLNITTQLKPRSIVEMETRSYIIDFHLSQNDTVSANEEFSKVEPWLNEHYMSDYVMIIGIDMYLINGEHRKVDYLTNKLKNSKNLHSRKYAYAVMADKAKDANDGYGMYYNLSEYLACFDSINANVSREAVIYKDSYYNYSLKEKENLQLKNEQKGLYLTILMIFILCLSITAIVVFLSVKNRNLSLQLRLQLSKIDLLQKDKQNLEIVEPDLSVDALKDLIRSKYIELTSNVNKQNYQVSPIILNSDIYNQFALRLTRITQKIGESEWGELDRVINEAYPDFKRNISVLCDKISNNNYRICMLIKCRFTQAEIGTIINMSDEGVSSVRRRLYKKCFPGMKCSASEWDKFIYSL